MQTGWPRAYVWRRRTWSARSQAVYGIGIIGSTVLVAAIGGHPDRFGHARDVGAYLGMMPKQDQSGDTDRQLHITRAGSGIVRTALVECAGKAAECG